VVLTNARVPIITFAHHTTHIFQVHDVDLFGSLRKHANGLKMFDEEQPAGAFLLRVYRDFKQTIIELHIWEAFAAIGFTPDIEQSPCGLLLDEQKRRQSPGLMELWENDRSLESLSKRRQNAKLGWINESEKIDLIHISYRFEIQNQRDAANHLAEKVSIGTGGAITLSLLCVT
jgi:hypothetical protein